MHHYLTAQQYMLSRTLFPPGLPLTLVRLCRSAQAIMSDLHGGQVPSKSDPAGETQHEGPLRLALWLLLELCSALHACTKLGESPRAIRQRVPA